MAKKTIDLPDRPKRGCTVLRIEKGNWIFSKCTKKCDECSNKCTTVFEDLPIKDSEKLMNKTEKIPATPLSADMYSFNPVPVRGCTVLRIEKGNWIFSKEDAEPKKIKRNKKDD